MPSSAGAIEWQKAVAKKGATMRLGALQIMVEKGSTAEQLYGGTEISERHRHRYEINPNYIDRIQEKGLKFTGRAPDGKRMEIAGGVILAIGFGVRAGFGLFDKHVREAEYDGKGIIDLMRYTSGEPAECGKFFRFNKLRSALF